MKMSHWASWLIIGGLVLDIIDAVTAPAAGQPGKVYGSGGPLASLSGKLPYSISIGEGLIAIGVGYHLFKGQQA
jgi:hypothetical protein